MCSKRYSLADMASTVISRAETLVIRCEICDKRFKNSRSLRKHGVLRHKCRPEILKLEENDGREIEDDQPKPQPIQSEADMRQFREWMAYLAEKIMSCLSPKITARWITIEEMIPQHYFGHILSLLVEQCGWVPLYAARRGPHKSPPYCKSLVSYSYRIYDWETILSLFKQQDDVSVAREKQWQGETVVRNITGVQLNPATARERLEKSFATGQEGYLAAGLNEVSDCCKFEVSE